MKKLYLIILLPIMLFMASCNDDGYSLDKYTIDIATVENPDNSTAFYLRLDDNTLLWVGASNFINYRPRTGQRVLANFTLLSDGNGYYDHDVKLNDVYTILTKGIFNLTEATQDSIGNNPIGVTDMWIGSHYLNVEFYYNGYSQTHYITLAKDDSQVYNDGKIHLEFRHNSNNDPERYRLDGIASFNLTTLQNTAQSGSVNLVVHYTNLNREKITKELTYNFGTNSSTSGKDYSSTYFDGENTPENVE